MTVSVICCYNNDKQFKEMCDSLAQQDCPCERIDVNNSGNAFSSAAAALNHGAALATGDILVFLHQDILFTKTDSLSRLASAVETAGNCIVGIAGAAHNERVRLPGGLLTAETLDECCIAMPRFVWENYKFNEIVCNGWHLYAVELCLRAGAEIRIASGEFDILHLSNGNVDEAYMRKFRDLITIYRGRGWIATTCKSLPASLPVFYCYYGIWKLKKTLLGNFPLIHSLKQLLKN